MEIVHTETNRGKKAIVVDNYLFRHYNTLKNGDITFVCSADKNCKKSITTNSKGVAIVKTKNEHSCSKEPSARQIESRLLRVRVRNQSGDVTKRPAAVIRNELREMEENKLQRSDLKNVSLSYRERHELPKDREATHDAVDLIDTITSNNEQFLISVNCSKLHGLLNQEHTGCRFPNGDHATLVEGQTDKLGTEFHIGYEELKQAVNSKFYNLEKLAPRPGQKRARNVSVSPKKSWKKARRRNSVVTADKVPAVVTSPVSRIATSSPPTFSGASISRKAKVEESTAGTVTANHDDASITGSWANSAHNEKDEGAVESRIRKTSTGQISLTVDPTDTIETVIQEMSPPAAAQTFVSAFERHNPPLVSSRPVYSAVQEVPTKSEQRLRTDVKLASWSDCQRGRVVLDVGGTQFTTSIATLTADPGSLLCSMVEPGSMMRPWRIDEHNSAVYFLDRDPAHFIHILNYLRLGNNWSAHSLPRELRYLYDIRAEAEHFMISGLQEEIERRIAIMSEATFDPSA